MPFAEATGYDAQYMLERIVPMVGDKKITEQTNRSVAFFM